MQTYYKEIHIQDKDTGDTQLKDTEKMEFAEYRANKHFSDVLINKLANDEDIQKYNKYEHDMETLRHTITSPAFRSAMEKACDEFDKFRRSGKGGFNDFIEYLEKRSDSDEIT